MPERSRAGTGLVVVGSANVDLVIAVRELPQRGDTVLATGMTRGAGGKGANQAVAAARDGAGVTFVGSLGRDADGDWLLGQLAEAGIDTSLVRRVGVPTGTAVVTVAEDGENAIVVVGGANQNLIDLTDTEVATIAGARVLLVQLEIPVQTVTAAIAAASDRATVVLNAAPALPLPDELLRLVDVLVVNETEARAMSGWDRSVPTTITTLGSRGVTLSRPDGTRVEVPGISVNAIDATAAGDTFCGVLGAALARGQRIEDAVERANAAASLAVRRRGAQSSIPHAAETDAHLTGGGRP
ncbi:ribokinase [Jatrophihabitans telluris]|uniref:Ribokinase n=1 Tax=Jatrophihabitans telluris TaxID=2038343 RepID=A0ABY4QW56_9ACTN|nr:ribokinase [Jatrophihabitans telluris]UQX87367.1 ribokinase [Jatrophihabitans telluris]